MNLLILIVILSVTHCKQNQYNYTNYHFDAKKISIIHTSKLNKEENPTTIPLKEITLLSQLPMNKIIHISPVKLKITCETSEFSKCSKELGTYFCVQSSSQQGHIDSKFLIKNTSECDANQIVFEQVCTKNHRLKNPHYNCFSDAKSWSSDERIYCNYILNLKYACFSD